MRARHAISLLALPLLLAACGGEDAPARQRYLADVLVQADEPLIRSRPQHVAGKFAEMGRRLYAYYRGTVPVFIRDWQNQTLLEFDSRFHVDSVLPLSIGDAHPENFGILVASDGTLALEPNDFDSADRYPYLWDVRRLVTGLALAARLARPDGDPDATARRDRDIARRAAVAYVDRLRDLAAGGPRDALTSPGANPILVDLFSRAQEQWDAREELIELTELDGNQRRLRRGVLAFDEPENVYQDLPPFALDALPATLETYRQTLIDPPDADFFRVLDAARELGSGVASWPRIRVIILVRGPSDAPEDDVLLEMKELTDSPVRGWIPPGVYYDDVGQRVRETARALWARPDAEPLWGTTHWLGIPMQIKHEAEGLKTVRTKRMEGDRGGVDALLGLADALGSTLARLHAAPLPDEGNPAAVLVATIDLDPDGFADEQADFAVAYADQVEADWAHLRQALADYGPTLGLVPDAADRPATDFAAVLGRPEPVLPIE